MYISDGTVTLEFNPIAYSRKVQDYTKIHTSDTKVVIATTAKAPPRRTRGIVIRCNSAELVGYQTFFGGNHDNLFYFTDEVGRIWLVRWETPLSVSEDKYTVQGHFVVSLELLLVAVHDDTGTATYANTDVGQMSIQKSGEPVLYFPLAYVHPLGERSGGTAYRKSTQTGIITDKNRFANQGTVSTTYRALTPAFVNVLEDYFVDTLEGAIHPFSLSHYRDATRTFYWVGGLRVQLGRGYTFSGSIGLSEAL